MKPGRCCGTDRTWFGGLQKQERPTFSGQFKVSRRVFHIRGDNDEMSHDPLVIQMPFHCEFCSETHDGDCPEDEYFWHWFDQTKNLAEGYGR